jgi:hypothetical protein
MSCFRDRSCGSRPAPDRAGKLPTAAARGDEAATTTFTSNHKHNHKHNHAKEAP